VRILAKEESGSLVSAGERGKKVAVRGGVAREVSDRPGETGWSGGTTLSFASAGSGAAAAGLSVTTVERPVASVSFSRDFSTPETRSEIPRKSSRRARFSLATASVFSARCCERVYRINTTAPTTSQAKTSTPALLDYSQVK
jgi:hypothetical protein